MELNPRGRRLWNALLLCWLGFYLVLGVRSLAFDDARYGWGMFSKQINYRLDYYWILEGGRRVPMEVEPELRGEAQKNLGAVELHRTRYGTGMVRHAVGQYLRHRLDAELGPLEPASRPAGAVGAGATFTYTVNRGDYPRVVELVEPADGVVVPTMVRR